MEVTREKLNEVVQQYKEAYGSAPKLSDMLIQGIMANSDKDAVGVAHMVRDRERNHGLVK